MIYFIDYYPLNGLEKARNKLENLYIIMDLIIHCYQFAIFL